MDKNTEYFTCYSKRMNTFFMVNGQQCIKTVKEAEGRYIWIYIKTEEIWNLFQEYEKNRREFMDSNPRTLGTFAADERDIKDGL